MNVKHRRCAENGCNTRPAFNWKGEEKGSFCNKHKEKGMVNVDKKEARAGGPVLAQRILLRLDNDECNAERCPCLVNEPCITGPAVSGLRDTAHHMKCSGRTRGIFCGMSSS